MLKFDGKEYRNLQEQVQKNKDDIQNIIQNGNIAELGIKVINAENPLQNATLLPDAETYDGNFGDGYIVGTATPYELYVYSRSSDPDVKGYWFDFGQLNAPSIVPGPIGPQGIQGAPGTRGSLWYSQSGAPTNTTGVNPGDQALDGTTGNVYEFINGAWQLTGNIRGPQGIQGNQGLQGEPGPQGLQGETGPAGPQGQFIQIVGELDNVDQLPMIDTVPRSSAYLIPDSSGVNHIWLIIGDGSTSNPYLWHDAGGFGGGTKVLCDSAALAEADISEVPKIGVNYQIADNTAVTVENGSVLFSNMQARGKNINNTEKDATVNIQLPITASSEIGVTVTDNTMQLELTQQVWNEVQSLVDDAKPLIVTINGSQGQGQLTESEMATLLNNPAAYISYYNELYRLQDNQVAPNTLVYSHTGDKYLSGSPTIQLITINTTTRGWALTIVRVSPILYRHILQLTWGSENNLLSATVEIISSNPNAMTKTDFSTYLFNNYYWSNTPVTAKALMTSGYLPYQGNKRPTTVWIYPDETQYVYGVSNIAIDGSLTTRAVTPSSPSTITDTVTLLL